MEQKKEATLVIGKKDVVSGGKRVFNGFGAFINGIVLSIIALALSLTIIGIVIATPLWMAAIVSFSVPFKHEANVRCPNCRKIIAVLRKQETVKCRKCKTNLTIDRQY